MLTNIFQGNVRGNTNRYEISNGKKNRRAQITSVSMRSYSV